MQRTRGQRRGNRWQRVLDVVGEKEQRRRENRPSKDQKYDAVVVRGTVAPRGFVLVNLELNPYDLTYPSIKVTVENVCKREEELGS